MFCSVKSGSIWGVEPYIVNIESDIQSGLPNFSMVGMLSSEVRESRERVRSSLKNCGYPLPLGRITVNLSPADKRKEGSGFDLPIAIALLCSMGILDVELFNNTLIVGELGLDGVIKSVRGILPICELAIFQGINNIIMPYDNRNEGFVCGDIQVLPFKSLREIIRFYSDSSFAKSFTDKIKHMEDEFNSNASEELKDSIGDFAEIRGQNTVKRAISIAVAGRHNLLMVGSPGVGKSMLASRITSIMPKMTKEESLEVTGIYSICGMLDGKNIIVNRPFRSPHHTITIAGLVGGGSYPRAGQITLAHRGVLFLDELPEFKENVIDSLRQPLEDKKVIINRINCSFSFPADCLVIGAMNPCKCGYYPDRNRCNCSENEVKKYLSKLSGPFLDRMDISVEVPRVCLEDENNGNNKYDNITSADMVVWVNNAMEMQRKRQGGLYNSELEGKSLRECCYLDSDSEKFMHSAYRKLGMSMRGYNKAIKIARTIADIGKRERITVEDLSEAIAYRMDVRGL